VNTHRQSILTPELAAKKLQRMALEIAEQNHHETSLLLAGIRGSGMVVARKLGEYLRPLFAGKLELLTLDIDKKHPGNASLQPPADVSGRVIILVDDVANSGRTMLYALKPLLTSYPRKIQTAALVERTHKSFPVGVDYTGLSVSTTPDQHILVEVEGEEITGAWMTA
jgi:pyrimidine operon attenuation protein/uracil phosphoribosyltransferase